MASADDSNLRVRTGAVELRLGVVDCLSAGFEKINGILWVLLLPVLLGVFLWQGPTLSAAPAIDRVANWYAQSIPADAIELTSGAGLSGQSPVRDLLDGVTAGGNLLWSLTLGIGLAGRGGLPVVPIANTGYFGTMASIQHPAQAVGVFVLLFALGLFLGVTYLGIIAQRIRYESTDLRSLARRVWGYWLSIAVLLVVLLLVALLVIVPIAFTLGIAFAFAPGAAEIIFWAVVAGWQIATIWLVLFTFFVTDAAVVGEVGPLHALRQSVSIVARNFWSSVGFIAVYLLITYGMLALWGRLGESPLATAGAIIANAYIASGLAAGSMVFYRTRALGLARIRVPAAEQT